jgi:RNA polymerase sigma-70 factor, ECF subfamily
MDQSQAKPAMRESLHHARRQFQDATEPYREDLWRHCRWLTGDPWDAEDLVQDTLLNAFANLSRRWFELKSMRAWLLRIATNRWIDRCRQRVPETFAELPEHIAPPEVDRVEFREAAEILLALPPRERAVVALVDGLGMSAPEAAECMVTSEGAIRAALHRGRARLHERRSMSKAATPPANVDAEVLEAFCRAFNARDLTAIRQLLLPKAHAEVLGLVREDDRGEIMDGSIEHTATEQGRPTAEVVALDGEALVVLTYHEDDGRPLVRDVLRFRTVDGKIAGMVYYYFTPQLLTEIGGRLGREVGLNGYWLKGS